MSYIAKKKRFYLSGLAAVIVGAVLTTSNVMANEGSQCSEGDWVFRRVGKELPVNNLTNIQKAHIAALEKSASPQHQKIAVNPTVFAYYKYLEDISIIADGECHGFCLGSLMIRQSGKVVLEDVILSARGGVPYDLIMVDSAGKYIPDEKINLRSQTEIYFGLLRPDGKTAFWLRKRVVSPGLDQVTYQSDDLGKPYAPRPKHIERKMFARGAVEVEIVKSEDNFPGIPKMYAQCGAFSMDGIQLNVVEFVGR